MRTLLALIAAACVGLAAGCSDESVAPDAGQTPGTVQGTIGDSDFELTFKTGGDPANPLDGPFVLRGSNVHYVDSLHALSVDLTITNRGRVPQPEPIGLTFIRLYPDSVTVLNPDNGINGNGAAIVFAFANDDAFWTPGERSLPRTVQFGVDPGVSIGFVARLDIGSVIEGGTIAGRVWNDTNEDGVADPDEKGLPGVLITLRTINDINDPSMRVTQELWRTLTGEDGHYEFSGLAAGVYIVSKALATVHFRPTTPTEITVVLTMHDGVVSDFFGADFGCVPMTPPPIEIGMLVATKGKYEPVPEPHLVATEIVVSTCGADTIPDPGIDDRQDCNAGVLRGVVTDIVRDQHRVWVMGTPIYFREIPVDLYPRQRIEVRVMQAGNVGAWTAVGWNPWDGEYDGVDGRVQDAGPGPDDVFRIRVVDTWIVPAHIVVNR